ncbi:hypothetical protein CFC21_056728 [Triticum aestivum]|uniref:Uncharacterized protein n=3 Tax=Triticum TaxID=4564 RepID=A0A9R0WA23_TRITD|nr:uncharacterized protein LOC119295097 [Triticum dicoccoides]XP_044368460.1 uncharacterized protein LOC123091120 [Triticum aestivum]KAF7047871.1 hypothetical protein CFC21_056728 [Triticum aestivum]VAI02507.1 unnamed protein product [Triticum turgidum subsp. durum]
MTQMEELVQECDMEVMKMAMLKHEQTFRQQVHDLHRLYRVQKQLMGDQSGRLSVPPCRQAQRRRQHPRRPELSLQLPVDDDVYTVFSAGTGRLTTPPSRESEDGLELTLAVGGGGGNGGSSRSQRRRRESATDCSGRSPQTPSSSTDSDEALRPVLDHHRRATACDLRGGVMVSKQPQWLVRCLSLRMA